MPVVRQLSSGEMAFVLLYLRKMCCPYFSPVEARAAAEDARHSMLPLGGFWAGVCGAGGLADDEKRSSVPLDVTDDKTRSSVLLDLRCCNLGYARGQCSRFPNDGEADAVRFTISSDENDSV